MSVSEQPASTRLCCLSLMLPGRATGGQSSYEVSMVTKTRDGKEEEEEECIIHPLRSTEYSVRTIYIAWCCVHIRESGWWLAEQPSTRDYGCKIRWREAGRRLAAEC